MTDYLNANLSAGRSGSMHVPFFSICIPAYNIGRAINYCLESIAGQTFGDYEVVLVDDGSSQPVSECIDPGVLRRIKGAMTF